MAPPAGTLRVGRYFLALLAILAVLYTIVFWPGARHTPKLGLDLEGGTQVIFTAKTPNGKTPSRSSMNEAKRIMEERVNGSGVTEATVVIQGSDQIVISIPGSTNTDIRKLGQAAQLSLRGNVMPAVPVTCRAASPAPQPSASASPSGSSTAPKASGSASSTAAAPNDAGARPLLAPTPSGSATGSATGSAPGSAKASPPASGSAKPSTAATPSGSASSAPTVPCVAEPLKGLSFPIPTTEAEFDKLSATQKQQLQAALTTTDCTRTSDQPDNAKTYVACDDGKTYGVRLAYLFGPTIVPGTEISRAAASAPNPSAGTTEWTVNLSMKSTGQANWAKYTSAHNIGKDGGQGGAVTQCGAGGTPCADYVGFVLDGQVISAPVNQSAINGGNTQITGNFTQTTANDLANQLRYGALPLSFSPSTSQTVSATLGSSQLKAGLLAGGIGLILVVIYSLIYYRALGFVTIASLVVSGLLTYGCLVMLGTQIGFTLSLAGIAGFIVAVGITADSFVVFFERIKDEVHDGRSVRVAVPRAWVRARRTILSADTVSFLAAAVLYYFAAGDVKGFAFTLGLSTVLDLLVVFLFTHPLVSLLSRSSAFGSSRFTGLNAVRAGGIVPDAAVPGERAAARPARPSKPAAKRGSSARPAAAPVAVLDREDEGLILTDDEAEVAHDTAIAPEAEAADVTEATSPIEPTEPTAPTAPTDSGTGTGTGETATEEPAERRRTTPEPGSAAERAAARRARLRGQGDEKGDQ